MRFLQLISREASEDGRTLIFNQPIADDLSSLSGGDVFQRLGDLLLPGGGIERPAVQDAQGDLPGFDLAADEAVVAHIDEPFPIGSFHVTELGLGVGRFKVEVANPQAQLNVSFAPRIDAPDALVVSMLHPVEVNHAEHIIRCLIDDNGEAETEAGAASTADKWLVMSSH